MRKTLVIAVREYQCAVRTKTFVVSLLIMPIMGSAGIVAALLLKDHVNLQDKRFAVLDHTGELFGPLAVAAEEYNQKEIFSKPTVAETSSQQIKPRFVLEHANSENISISELRAHLSDRVRKGELAAFVEIGALTLEASAVESKAKPSVTYHSNNPMYRDFLVWLQSQLNQSARQWRIADAGLHEAAVNWATRRVSIGERPLYARAGDGVAIAGHNNEHYVSIAAGAGMALLMFLVVLVGALPLTYSVLEEKMQRTAEVLLGSVTPFQFMMGKILGMVGVSLSIVTIYIVIGVVVADFGGYGHTIPRHLINWFLLYQAGSILMFGSLFAAVGAACNDMKDAQNLMTPAALIACTPVFLIHPVMVEPNSTFSTLVSFFPPAAPMLMVLRLGLPAPIPIWQPLLGLVIVLLTAFLSVGLAARVFRVGILMQGNGANIKQLIQWAFYGVGHRPQRPERRRSVVSLQTT